MGRYVNKPVTLSFAEGTEFTYVHEQFANHIQHAVMGALPNRNPKLVRVMTVALLDVLARPDLTVTHMVREYMHDEAADLWESEHPEYKDMRVDY